MSEAVNHHSINIRHTLKAGDVGQIIYLHGTLYAEEYGLSPAFEGYVACGLGKFAESPDGHKDRIWIAELNGQIVGSIAIVEQSEAVAQLRWFLIHPQARRLGLGRKLVKDAIAFSRIKEQGLSSDQADRAD